MQLLDDSSFSIAAAARCLQEGQLVAFPTETVYGLGADATSDRAVAAIFSAKGRPQFNPLIVHLSEPDQAAGYVRLVEHSQALMRQFWPGPLTLVLPRLEDSAISLLCSSGLPSLAVRCPSHSLARELIDAAGLPIAAPSANRSGMISATMAEHVLESFSDSAEAIAAVVESGRCCQVGLESTVLDLTGEAPVILRPGGIVREEIEDVLGVRVFLSTEDPEKPKSPGQMTSHYAPRLPLRLNVEEPNEGEAFLGFGWPGAGVFCHANLSRAGDLHEAAANLFRLLWSLDHPETYAGIAVAPIPEEGLGIAINDRLRRAAAKR